MYIIVGLGNPTREYENTRHNVGFDAIDEIAKDFNIPLDFIKHKAICGKGFIGREKIILAKPTTYMNLSGESVRELIDYYKIENNKLILIYDDISLDLGKIRIRKKGSAGGHNGIKSIIGHLDTDEFIRIKIGIDKKPAKWDLADYVLSRFTKEERETIDKALWSISKICKVILEEGVCEGMNRFN